MPATLEITHQFEAARAAGREPFKVRDLALAGLGRAEIRLAEHEMPGLMAIRQKYAASKPLAGARVMGSLHMTVQRSEEHTSELQSQSNFVCRPLLASTYIYFSS